VYPCVVLLCFVVLSWQRFAISIHQIVNLSPRRPKPVRHKRHGGTPFGGWGWVVEWEPLSAVMRASPSTCRVLTIDWQVRGLCSCLCYACGLCLCPCVISPKGLLPSQQRRRSIVFRVLFQQTNKQTKRLGDKKKKKRESSLTHTKTHATCALACKHCLFSFLCHARTCTRMTHVNDSYHVWMSHVIYE